MKLKCPNCDVDLPARQMNAQADVAVCRECDEAFRISTLLGTEPVTIRNAGWVSNVPDSFDINQPPSGITYDNHGMGWRIASTTRNALAFFMVPFMCVWSGFTLGGIYGTQIVNGKFELMQSLFGIPFLLGTLLFGSIALLSVAGRMVIRSDEMDHDAGSIFLGVGPIGWTTRFRWSDVLRVEEGYASGNNGNHSKQLTLVRDRGDIHFGSMLSEQRRRYVLHALQQLISNRAF